MATLNLNRERQFHTLVLPDGKEYKIPSDLTVAEVERILEKQAAMEALVKEEASDEDGGAAQLREFFNNLFAQLEVLFQHFHPEVTEAYLRYTLSQQQALEIIGFEKSVQAKIPGKGEDADAKKKLQTSSLGTSDGSSSTSSPEALPS